MLASGMVLLMLVLNCECTSSNQSTGASLNPSMEGQPLTAETKLEEEPLTAEVELEEGQGKERAERMGFQDRHRLLMLFVILPIHLIIAIKVSCTAAFFGQLTPNTGLAYEGYDLCLTSGLLWIVAQALAVRAEDFAAHYSAADVAFTMLMVVPFLGDGFDSLKDAMLGALALRSQRIWLQCLGLAALSYLVILHGFLAQSSSNRLELQKILPSSVVPQKETSAERQRSCRGNCARHFVGRCVAEAASGALQAIHTLPPVGNDSGRRPSRCVGSLGVIGRWVPNLHPGREHRCPSLADYACMVAAR